MLEFLFAIVWQENSIPTKISSRDMIPPFAICVSQERDNQVSSKRKCGTMRWEKHVSDSHMDVNSEMIVMVGSHMNRDIQS